MVANEDGFSRVVLAGYIGAILKTAWFCPILSTVLWGNAESFINLAVLLKWMKYIGGEARYGNKRN